MGKCCFSTTFDKRKSFTDNCLCFAKRFEGTNELNRYAFFFQFSFSFETDTLCGVWSSWLEYRLSCLLWLKSDIYTN